MMTLKRTATVLGLALAAGVGSGLPATAAGLLRPVDAAYGDLEIAQHKVQVVINNGFAKTEVDQVFRNPHPSDLEARYSFPVPKQAAMSELSLWVDGRERLGEVLAKAEAQTAYEEEKGAGRDAGLAEKDSYRTFEVSVAPVRAGKEVRVRLVYYQPLDIDTGIGRYVYPLEEGGVDDARQQAFFLNDAAVGEAAFSMDLTLKSAAPVEAVLVPSHPEASVARTGDGGYRVALSSAGTMPLRRDFVVNYRLAGRPSSVELIPYREEGDKEGSFMAVVTPGDDLKRISEGSDWTFVLDVSGSMQGKLAALAEGVRKALGQLRPDDRFRIAAFNHSARWVVEPYTAATQENVGRAIALVEGLRPEGGTDLYAGIQLGLSGLEPDRTSAVLLATDGVANHGVTEHKRFLELMKRADVRLFTFVMGNSANTPLLEDLAKGSNGFSLNLSNDDAIVGQILLARSKVTHKAMHDVRLAVKGARVSELAPSEPSSLYRGDQLVVFGRYRDPGPATLRFTARVSGKPMQVDVPVMFPETDVRSPEVERLWALAKIEDLERQKRLGGDAAELEGAVRDLGVRYSLVTDHTAMVVMEDGRFAERGIERRNLARVGRERAAQRARAAAAPVSYAKAYSSSGLSASGSARLGGGGSVGPLFGLLSAGLAFGLPALRRRRR